MLFATVALVVLLQTGPVGTVTYTNTGARLERLLPDLSEATGLTLEPSKQMQDVILTLRLDKAPIGASLKNLEVATRGTWRQMGGKYVLYEDSQGIAREQQKLANRHQQ